jgi:hypothetical protein
MNLNILFDIIPAKHRLLVYRLATLALGLYGLWEISHGDVKAFLISVGSAVVTSLASSNTVAVGKEAQPDLDEDPEDDDDGDDTVADVLNPDYPEHDESDTDVEYPNSETLYQPGEKPYERFGGRTSVDVSVADGSVGGVSGNGNPNDPSNPASRHWLG